MPFKIISHFVNRSLAALRVYEIVLKCLSVIMHPEAKCYKTPPPTVADLKSKCAIKAFQHATDMT